MRAILLGVVLGLAMVGCTAASDGSGRDLSPLGTGGPTAGGGSSNGDTPLAPGDFGNSQDPVTPATPGAGDGDGASQDPIENCPPGERCYANDPDPMDCGTVRLETEVEVVQKPGNVLLVFDRSGSMDENWNGQQRWMTAGNAISNALTPLADNLTVGSVFFPSPDGDPTCVDPTGIACIFVPNLLGNGTCTVNPMGQDDQLPFAPGQMFLSQLATGMPPLYAPVNGGRTPLKEGLQEAQRALAESALPGVTSVVVITDGAPNCQWDGNVAQQIVTDWHAQGINTHVIGLPGADGNATAVLDALANAGGTGTYITPQDAGALEQKLREIAQETVRSGFNSCDIALDPPAEVPEKLRMVVTQAGQDLEVQRMLSDDAGWNITADGSMVTIEGTLCEEAKAGAYEEIRFEFSCKEIPPLPVPEVR